MAVAVSSVAAARNAGELKAGSGQVVYRPRCRADEKVRTGQKKRMADLSQLLQQGMRRRHLNAQALAARTGIRTPRIRVFGQDGARGPVHPPQAEPAELGPARLRRELVPTRPRPAARPGRS